MLHSRIGDLDEILGGGFRGGEILLLSGPTGSGKTTLALQLAFRLSHGDRPSIFVSTPAEPAPDLLRHASSFRFYDADRLGRDVHVVDVAPDDELRFPDDLFRILESGEPEPVLVVVDGIDSLLAPGGAAAGTRRLLHRLRTFCRTRDCVGLVTSSEAFRAHEEGLLHAAAADGLVELTEERPGTGGGRSLRVRKLRGRSPLPGRHPVWIGLDGLTPLRRLETLPMRPRWSGSRSRVPWGVAELDRLMSGGPLAGDVTVIAGEAATGKTLLGLRFLERGLESDGSALLVCLRETPGLLLERGARVGVRLEPYLLQGRLSVVFRSPTEIDPDELARVLHEKHARAAPGRVLLDGLDELADAVADPGRIGILASVLTGVHRGVEGATVATVRSGSMEPRAEARRLALARTVADNLVTLERRTGSEHPGGVLAVAYMKDSEFDPSPRDYRVETGEGFVVHVGRPGPPGRADESRSGGPPRFDVPVLGELDQGE